ncbi:MAG TPA: FHA domain-containing protein, partial [Phycisphaerae bacterium]|nr:FHA domain-containing protein [Phycisphaerae bacterium]
MNVILVGFTKKGVRKDIPLPGPTTVIGRTPEADIQIPVSDVSRRHCQIAVNGAKVMLKDLGSSNGTFVNDTKVGETTLRPGDRLKVGPFTFVIQIDGKPEKIQSAAPKPPATPTPKPAAAAAKPAAKSPAPAAAPAPAGSGSFDLSDLDVDNLDLDDMSPIEDLDELVEIDSDELEELD